MTDNSVEDIQDTITEHIPANIQRSNNVVTTL